MAEAVHTPPTRFPYLTLAALCLLPWGVSMAAQTSVPSISQQIEQQRRAQAEFRRALDDSERRIAADQAEQLRRAQERSEQQRRALARREAEQRKEELLIQAGEPAKQSNPEEPRGALEVPQTSQEAAAGPPAPSSALAPLPRRYLFMRQIGLVLMIGASVAALFVLGRIVQQSLAR
jgi:hypothetical protein